MGPAKHRISEAHALVVGAGGIGCPAAWALSRMALRRLTIVDPDSVELSNLPRQVLYTPEDVGQPKALVAAAALQGGTGDVRGVHQRLDHTNADDLLEGVDVVVDATDGARTKDWLNQLAVRRGLPLVHAAGLRSEGRLLAVPAGGRPCLACLFGRLDEETGSCADLGVWNGAVGAIGLLAARAAFALLAAPRDPGPGYLVLDLESGRHMQLGAAPDPTCPVCAGRGRAEPYPDDVACAASDEFAAPADSGYREALDLRTERCPLNLLRARRALEAAPPGGEIDIHLGAEGAATVPDGVRALGHTILASEPRGEGLDLRVRACRQGGPGDAPRLDERALQRYARQVVLPEVGESGQRRLLDASVRLAGSGAAHEIASLYLAAAGIGQVTSEGAGHDVVAWAGGDAPPDQTLRSGGRPALVVSDADGSIDLREDWAHPLVVPRGSTDPVLGALLADAVQRLVVTGRTPLVGTPLAALLS